MGDKGSDILRLAIGLLLLRRPERTALGLLIGCGLVIAKHAFAPFWATIRWLDLEAVSDYLLILFGVPLTHIPILKRLLQTESEFDEATEQAFAAIAKAKKEGLSEAHVKMLYRQLCEKAIEKAGEPVGEEVPKKPT